ncbi:MAG: AIR synthase family protein [Thermofilaceae archaeon]|nr:AIR synthase family protein [Thermofilaceae archaeon]MDW8004338.1 AIR synthase family protein [Thermofilaceae archaeon]
MSGKVPPRLLESLVFTKLGTYDPAVLVGPAVGEDAAIIDLGNGSALVVHNDAISGASTLLGWLAVHIVANDVATRGVKPRWFLMTLFLPENASPSLLENIMSQVDSAARELEMMVVGGHTETTPGLERPLVGTTAIGVAPLNQVVSTKGARVGDFVILTKYAGIEGTAVICTDFCHLLVERGVPREVIEKGSRLVQRVSVVPEALALAEKRLATAMHDPTEGGVLGGAAELAYASKKTLELWADKVPILNETRAVTEALGLDPLKLISSGTLIATVPASKVDEAIEVVKNLNLEASVVGRVKEWNGHLVELIKGGTVTHVDDVYVADELFKLWKN